MFRYTKWKWKVKVGLLGFFILIGIIVFNFPSKEVTPAVRTSKEAEQAVLKPTETPKPVEKYKVEVASQIVKKVDGKYRYFFDIRNNDTKDFEGDVSITLYNELQKSTLGGDTFSTTRAIEPTLGTSQYIDIYTGPVSVHGENGISKFKFIVKKNGEIVSEGEGQITKKFEDLDSYNF